MQEFNESALEIFDNWMYKGINVGMAIRKQICDGVKAVEVEDGTDENGKTIIFDKPYCPDCKEISYSGNYCTRCGKRLRG